MECCNYSLSLLLPPFGKRNAFSVEASIIFDAVVMLGTVPSPRGAFLGLAPQTKLQAPQNWNMKKYKLVEFLSIWNGELSPHERKAPSHKRKAPLLTTSWLRFWLGMLSVMAREERATLPKFASRRTEVWRPWIPQPHFYRRITSHKSAVVAIEMYKRITSPCFSGHWALIAVVRRLL